MEQGMPRDYVERVYAGWLGKIIGVRHGSNIEGWTYDTIQAIYGEIEGYLFDFKNFAADDDTNGPIFFIRALEDYTHTRALTAEQIGLAWQNYAPFEHGFYWWGGYGKSTEHTAYLNMRSGIPAPRAGSIAQNGAAVAEQIGGQIFIDTWGLAIPCDYELAAEYAQKAASVAHGGNGVYGGMFVAACISAAFRDISVPEIIECGLSVIPAECAYARMSRDMMRFHAENPDNWRDCFGYVRQNYGYDRYPGACHIIPNSAVIVLSLLYGGGDFSRSINICNMCGWDTDCNVANVGAILGVHVGLAGIDDAWRAPIGDFLAASSVIGSLNILDVAQTACYIAGLGYRIAGVEPEAAWRDIVAGRAAACNFELPGSTHAFRFSTTARSEVGHVLAHTTEAAYTGTGALKVAGRVAAAGEEINAFVKTHYRPADFDDSRYDPAFSPTLYPGQVVTASVMLGEASECGALVCLYVRDDNSGAVYVSEKLRAAPGVWQQLRLDIPALEGACLSEAGVKLISLGGERDASRMLLAYIDDFDFSGEADYTLDFAKERVEIWTLVHREVSQCTYLKGIWDLEEGALVGSCADYGEAYTGHIAWKDYSFTGTMRPVIGAHHRLNFRVQGAIRSYAVGLAPDNQLVLYKNDNGYRPLASVPYSWALGEAHTFTVQVQGGEMVVLGKAGELLRFTDTDAPYLTGQVGFSVAEGSRCAFLDVRIGRV